MNIKKFSEAMGELDGKYVNEAVNYQKKRKSPIWIKLGILAACLAALIVIGGMLAPFQDSMVVSAYVSDTGEELTSAGAIISSGTISDSGKMKGHPMMFYLSGKDIVSVRFSCKNQQINFMDWTEKREEYGNAQNFTVAYGEDESEYYYLTIDWVPNATIRELTDKKDSKITTLPEEMRHDLIVMEITFENGKTATKAITISLLDNGTFFASFDDYEITDSDMFVKRPDSEAIPRAILYAQGAAADAAPMVYVNDTLYKQSTAQTFYQEQKEDFVYLGVIESDITHLQGDTGTGNAPTPDGVPKENFQANHPIVGSKVYQYGDAIVVEIEGKYWLYEMIDDNASGQSDGLSEEEKMQLDPSYGAGIDTNPDALPDETPDSAIEAIAREYYSGTVFDVVSMELKSHSPEEITYSVCVSKGGVIQEPYRMITLHLNNGVWEVINEGY